MTHDAPGPGEPTSDAPTDDAAPAEAEAASDADEVAPKRRRLRMPSAKALPLANLRNEARVGLAAILSFVILVGFSINSRMKHPAKDHPADSKKGETAGAGESPGKDGKDDGRRTLVAALPQMPAGEKDPKPAEPAKDAEPKKEPEPPAEAKKVEEAPKAETPPTPDKPKDKEPQGLPALPAEGPTAVGANEPPLPKPAEPPASAPAPTLAANIPPGTPETAPPPAGEMPDLPKPSAPNAAIPLPIPAKDPLALTNAEGPSPAPPTAPDPKATPAPAAAPGAAPPPLAAPGDPTAKPGDQPPGLPDLSKSGVPAAAPAALNDPPKPADAPKPTGTVPAAAPAPVPVPVPVPVPIPGGETKAPTPAPAGSPPTSPPAEATKPTEPAPTPAPVTSSAPPSLGPEPTATPAPSAPVPDRPADLPPATAPAAMPSLDPGGPPPVAEKPAETPKPDAKLPTLAPALPAAPPAVVPIPVPVPVPIPGGKDHGKGHEPEPMKPSETPKLEPQPSHEPAAPAPAGPPGSIISEANPEKVPLVTSRSKSGRTGAPPPASIESAPARPLAAEVAPTTPTRTALPEGMPDTSKPEFNTGPDEVAPKPVAKPQRPDGFEAVPTIGKRRPSMPRDEVARADVESPAMPPPRRGFDKPATKVDDTSRDRLDPILHKVQRGENFYTIAKLYYNSGRYYQALWYANRDKAERPEDLYVGTVIKIPPEEELDRKQILAVPAPKRTAAAEPLPEGSPVQRASQAVRSDGTAAQPDLNVSSGLGAPRRRRQVDVDDGKPVYPMYRVRKNGETLRRIASDTLGDPRRYMEIYELNREVIKDPRNPDLAVGQTLNLPLDATVGRNR